MAGLLFDHRGPGGLLFLRSIVALPIPYAAAVYSTDAGLVRVGPQPQDPSLLNDQSLSGEPPPQPPRDQGNPRQPGFLRRADSDVVDRAALRLAAPTVAIPTAGLGQGPSPNLVLFARAKGCEATTRQIETLDPAS